MLRRPAPKSGRKARSNPAEPDYAHRRWLISWQGASIRSLKYQEEGNTGTKSKDLLVEDVKDGDNKQR